MPSLQLSPPMTPMVAPRGGQLYAAERRPTTVQGVLHDLLPWHFAGKELGLAQASPIDATLVFVQGIRVPLETPLAWLAETCSHPDGWLYISVQLRSQA